MAHRGAHWLTLFSSEKHLLRTYKRMQSQITYIYKWLSSPIKYLISRVSNKCNHIITTGFAIWFEQSSLIPSKQQPGLCARRISAGGVFGVVLEHPFLVACTILTVLVFQFNIKQKQLPDWGSEEMGNALENPLPFLQLFGHWWFTCVYIAINSEKSMKQVVRKNNGTSLNHF